MVIRLTADTRDDDPVFVLYDRDALPAARWDEVLSAAGGQMRREALRRPAAEGLLAVHVAELALTSPDHPGTERRHAWVCVDEALPEELADRSTRVVEGARLSVPSGTLTFAGARALRRTGAPARDGARHDEATIPPGDYRLDIYVAEWGEGERERFVAERVRPGDLSAEHRLGCLGGFVILSSFVVPVALLLGYFLLPLLGADVMHEDAWKWSLGGLLLLWLVVFFGNKTPTQRRIVKARLAREALGLPTVVYALSTAPPGSAPAFHRERR